ncbi:MAG TPA: LysM peptidoglycan-binding domain-containing protein, partial [Candidatus Binatia bacterium]|nr:LysM peptidoglycan-binding domain-containing protein [Candidatus Binatia bacterium]
MRVAKLQVRLAVPAMLLSAFCGCQSAHKPVALVPAASAAPAPIQAVAATAVAPSQPAPAAAAPASQSASHAEPAAAPTTSKAPVSDQAVGSDAIAELIAKVEKDYQSGLDSYHAGQVDAAKRHFDDAFNALLDSNLDIRADERLEKEFDHIVDGVNQLDLGGMPSDSEAQQSEPAPIDETNGITPSADPRVRAKAQAEIKHTHSDLPLMMTDQVAGYISYFSNRGRGTFERAYARSGRYREVMLPILKEEGVPQDLIYLAQAESGFHPLAVSRVGARGIWQFMASRARGYGLNHNMWVDDRQDPVKSTRAAARHLKDLYNEFGDWYLAMAAYNSGPGTVQAAVKRTGYADFWELYRRNVLPKETRNYVPIILAVTIMAKNMSQYGFDDVSLDEPVPYDSLAINYPVDLRLVAECVGSTPEQSQDMNPSLLRRSTPATGTFELHLPAGTKGQYQTAIANVPADMRLWWRYHQVQAGDTLASIARAYRVTAKSIVSANRLDTDELNPGAQMLIPIAPGKHAGSDNATYARRITRYKVRRGDTVESVAESFGVSPQMLRRWNGLHGDSLMGRKVLALHLPVAPGTEAASSKSISSPRPRSNPHMTNAKASTKTAPTPEAGENETASPPSVLHHTVRSGETLYSIATAYKTTVEALKRNNGNVAVLHPGMILIVQAAH